MNRLFLGNFEFESRLAQAGHNLSLADRRRNLELSFAWLSVATSGDSILVDEPPPAEFLDTLSSLGRGGVSFVTHPPTTPLTITPWGWTADLARWAGRVRLPVDPPPLAVVAEANARGFSYQQELDRDIGLDGQAMADSLAGVERAIAGLDHWLIKARFGASGRERLVGGGANLRPEEARWIERRLAADGVVFVEPRMTIVEEAGLQWDVPRDPIEPPQLIGVTRLHSDPRGQFAASEFFADVRLEQDWAEAVEQTHPVVADLQQRGYFGPLGIDAMRYRDAAGRQRLRPLQDINARWTMGRLALGWKPLLRPGQCGRFGSPDASDNLTGEVRRSFRLSPSELSGQPVRHSFHWQTFTPSGGA